jgi:hypothetical protein
MSRFEGNTGGYIGTRPALQFQMPFQLSFSPEFSIRTIEAQARNPQLSCV